MDTSGGLRGWKLRAYRAAVRLHLNRLFTTYRRWVFGDCCVILPYFDPLDAGHILLAMSYRIAEDCRDEIHIRAIEFRQWLTPDILNHPDFNDVSIFRDLRCQIGLQLSRPRLASYGDAGVSFFVSTIPDGVRLLVLHRRERGPKLTRGQMHHLFQTIERETDITPESINRCRAEAAAHDWPSPFPDLRDDEPVEIVIRESKRRRLMNHIAARFTKLHRC